MRGMIYFNGFGVMSFAVRASIDGLPREKCAC